jgi:asparagine synthase (glutamine-hydrolysing)
MGQEIYSGVIISSQQLVGYWGELDRSAKLLAISADLKAVNIQPVSENPMGLSAAGLALDIWTRQQDQCLVLGREPFGCMSLYWTQIDATIYFASHLRLLLPLLTQPVVNHSALLGYSCFSYVPNPLTPIEGVHSLVAGQELQWSAVDQPAVTINQYHWPQVLVQITDEEVAIAQLQNLLQSAIQNQIQDLPDAPVGVLLSGGLDSSIAAALLVQNGVKVLAYTLDFGEYGSSEQPYAEQVAAHLHIPLRKISVQPQLVKRSINATAQALDTPLGDGVTVPLYLLCQAARTEVSVIFNGEGGDQLFGGWTNKPLIAASIYGGDADFRGQYLQTFHRLSGYAAQVFQPQMVAQLPNPADWISPALAPNPAYDLLHRLRQANLMLKGAQNIQLRAANLASWHGLQVRSIFCDLPLAEWTFGIAGTLHLQGSCEKYILKKAVDDLLPAEIVWRTKRGMGVPLTPWLMTELWSDLGTWLNPQVLKQAGCWQPDLAARLVSGQLGGAIQGRRIGEILWLIIMWERWRTQVLREPSAPLSWHHPFWWPPSLWQAINSRTRDR